MHIFILLLWLLGAAEGRAGPVLTGPCSLLELPSEGGAPRSEWLWPLSSGKSNSLQQGNQTKTIPSFKREREMKVISKQWHDQQGREERRCGDKRDEALCSMGWYKSQE